MIQRNIYIYNVGQIGEKKNRSMQTISQKNESSLGE